MQEHIQRVIATSIKPNTPAAIPIWTQLILWIQGGPTQKQKINVNFLFILKNNQKYICLVVNNVSNNITQ